MLDVTLSVLQGKWHTQLLQILLYRLPDHACPTILGGVRSDILLNIRRKGNNTAGAMLRRVACG